MSHYPEGCIEPEDRANWDFWQNQKKWEADRPRREAHWYDSDPWTTTGTRKAIKVTPEDEEPF